MQDVFRAQRLDRIEHLGLLVADGVGAERCWRLHRREADELHHVVGHHVAQRAGGVEVAASQFDAHRLGIGNCNVIDVPTVPDRLEDPVAEAEHHDVLHGLFAEIMIDAVNLLL